jgi:hypothetical protein
MHSDIDDDEGNAFAPILFTRGLVVEKMLFILLKSTFFAGGPYSSLLQSTSELPQELHL